MNQPLTRVQLLRPFVWVRNGFIALGIIGGASLGAWRYQSEFAAKPAANASPGASSGSPILLQAALPPRPRLFQLSNPVSLDGSFGREQLTGNPALDGARDALAALPIDRSHDRALPVLPPLPPGELPAAAAPDEVRERDRIEAPTVRYGDFETLPREARTLAEAAATLLQQASKIASAASPSDPAWFENQAKAAGLLRDARDKLYKALDLAPDAKVLLDLMQEVKFALYSATKTGKK